jgi:hypothetical protein
MPIPNDSECPRCGRTDAELLSRRAVYSLADAVRQNPLGIVAVYKCKCGMAYTVDSPTQDSEANCRVLFGTTAVG